MNLKEGKRPQLPHAGKRRIPHYIKEKLIAEMNGKDNVDIAFEMIAKYSGLTTDDLTHALNKKHRGRKTTLTVHSIIERHANAIAIAMQIAKTMFPGVKLHILAMREG